MRRRHVANENCVLGGSLFERIAFPRTGCGLFNCFWCCFSPSSFLFRRRVSEFVTNQPLDRWQLPISIVPIILLCTLLSPVFVINFILKNQKEKRLSSYCFQQHLFSSTVNITGAVDEDKDISSVSNPRRDLSVYRTLKVKVVRVLVPRLECGELLHDC